MTLRGAPMSIESSAVDRRAGRAENAPVVLVVDDDRGVLDAMRDTLSEEGFVVLTASNGVEAIRTLDSVGRPSVVIVDLSMPVMNGWELLGFLGVHYSDLPVVVVSAHGAAPGVDRFLRKPFDLHDLISTVRELSSTRVPQPV